MSYDIVGSEVVCGVRGRFRRVKITETTWEEMNAEILRLREDNRKLREAVIFERAQYIWGHRKCEDGKVAFAVAERELRAEVEAKRNLAPAMLSVLECFREGDAEAIQEIIDGLRYAMERAVPIDPGNMEPLLKRLQKAASLMEQDS